ncbi:MAG: AI-2E family transporter [Collinsella sp.]
MIRSRASNRQQTGPQCACHDLTLTLRIRAVVGRIVIAAVIFNLMGILAPVIEFLAVGSIIAFVMSPITNWLEHHGIGRGIGSLIALIVVVAVLVGVVCILSPILFGQIMEVLSRLPEQLRVAGGDLNEMISHAKTLNNTPLKEYLDDNLSSLVTVASKYVSQIAAELGRGVFPLITNTASQLFVIFLGLRLPTGCCSLRLTLACTTRFAPSSMP